MAMEPDLNMERETVGQKEMAKVKELHLDQVAG
jgi:hypothetical protein